MIRFKIASALHWLSTLAAAVMLGAAAMSLHPDDHRNAADPKIFKAEDPKHLKLAIVTNNAADFWKIVHAGVKQFEKESGVEVSFRMPEAGRVSDQDKIVSELTDDGCNGMAVSCISAGEQAESLKAVAEKTNLITFDSDCPKSDRILFIGTDNKAAGKKVGEQIVKLLPHGGKIALFVGMFEARNAADRTAGIEEAIKDHDIEIIEKAEDSTDRAKARSNMNDVLKDHPDVNMLVGLWSYEGPAIVEAIKDAGKKGKVMGVAFDEEPATLQGVKDGYLEFTCLQRPFQLGYLTAEWLKELAVKGDAAELPKDRTVDTGVTILKAEDVDGFKEKLEEILGKN